MLFHKIPICWCPFRNFITVMLTNCHILWFHIIRSAQWSGFGTQTFASDIIGSCVNGEGGEVADTCSNTACSSCNDREGPQMSDHHKPLLSRQPRQTDPMPCRTDPSSPIRKHFSHLNRSHQFCIRVQRAPQQTRGGLRLWKGNLKIWDCWNFSKVDKLCTVFK